MFPRSSCIRANRASQLNIILNEAVEGFSIKVLYRPQVRMRLILLPSASVATTNHTLLKVFRPVAPPNSDRPLISLLTYLTYTWNRTSSPAWLYHCLPKFVQH